MQTKVRTSRERSAPESADKLRSINLIINLELVYFWNATEDRTPQSDQHAVTDLEHLIKA